MSRIINTASPGKERNQLRRTAAELIRHLMFKQRVDEETKDMLAALVYALKSIPHFAMSLEHRGLGRSGVRTEYRKLKAKGGLFTQMLVSVMIPTVFWLLFNTL